MSKKTEYWPSELVNVDRGYMFELRTALAWDLVHHFGSIAADSGGEDSAGRSQMRLQAPAELISRCFRIADAFVDEAERRGELSAVTMTREQASEYVGRLDRIKSRAEYPVNDMPNYVSTRPVTVSERPMSEDMMKLRAEYAQKRAELRAKEDAEAEKTQHPAE